MSARVLVLSASVGAGHVRAGEAVEAALRRLDPGATVRHLDVLETTNATFRRLYGRAYLDLVNKAPHVLGYFYDILDRPVGLSGMMGDRLRVLVERLNLDRFLGQLHGERWDVIVNTHFLPAEMVARLKRKGLLDTPQATVTTDFDTHRLWVNQPCERYFTATEEGAAYLASWGIPAADIATVGIPVHPHFSDPKERGALGAKYRLAGDRPVVLQLAGGFGVGPIEKIYRALLTVAVPLEAFVVTGRNEEAKRQLEAVPVPSRHRARVLGFTDRMDELMALAQLVLSKPGGLTTSEALASGVPMAIINPTPGQESRNNDYLLEHGAAIKIQNVATLGMRVGRLLGDPARFSRLTENARRLGRPRAAFDVAEAALGLGTTTPFS